MKDSFVQLAAPLNAVVAATRVAMGPYADGIYFGLDEDAYHADPALGSTDMRKLSYSPPDYWFTSPLNPHKQADESTPSQLFGRAMHKMVLEGRDAFDAGYSPTRFNGSTKDGKAERADIAAAGKVALKADDYERILIAGTMIRANPYIADAFKDGEPEVSIFWTANGIRKKARIDYLKHRANSDLKSIRNTRSMDFPKACKAAMAEWNYPVQAEHYAEGRRAMRALVDAGAVFGDCDREWLSKVADQDPFASAFVFYQAEGAPLTWGLTLTAGNGLLDIARRTLELAEHNYLEFKERFGVSEPWIIAEPLAELDINEMPLWYGR